MTRLLAFLIVCVQACLIQNVFSQCLAGPGLAGPYGVAGPYGAAAPCGAAYGGAGVGNVAVTGQLPVCGRTAIAGQVPIIGAVSFGGTLPAAGAVTIVGDCACGCGPGPYGIY